MDREKNIKPSDATSPPRSTKIQGLTLKVPQTTPREVLWETAVDENMRTTSRLSEMSTAYTPALSHEGVRSWGRLRQTEARVPKRANLIHLNRANLICPGTGTQGRFPKRGSPVRPRTGHTGPLAAEGISKCFWLSGYMQICRRRAGTRSCPSHGAWCSTALQHLLAHTRTVLLKKGPKESSNEQGVSLAQAVSTNCSWRRKKHKRHCRTFWRRPLLSYIGD